MWEDAQLSGSQVGLARVVVPLLAGLSGCPTGPMPGQLARLLPDIPANCPNSPASSVKEAQRGAWHREDSPLPLASDGSQRKEGEQEASSEDLQGPEQVQRAGPMRPRARLSGAQPHCACISPSTQRGRYRVPTVFGAQTWWPGWPAC